MEKNKYSYEIIPGEWHSLPDVFSVFELAQFLKIGMNMAYELSNREDFPSFRLGKNIRVTKAGLQAWIERYLS